MSRNWTLARLSVSRHHGRSILDRCELHRTSLVRTIWLSLAQFVSIARTLLLMRPAEIPRRYIVITPHTDGGWCMSQQWLDGFLNSIIETCWWSQGKWVCWRGISGSRTHPHRLKNDPRVHHIRACFVIPIPSNSPYYSMPDCSWS
jgi:hypothetical protein